MAFVAVGFSRPRVRRYAVTHAKPRPDAIRWPPSSNASRFHPTPWSHPHPPVLYIALRADARLALRADADLVVSGGQDPVFRP